MEELEFHQLDVRYEALRVRRPEQEKRLLGSLSGGGQQVPIVVVASSEPGRFVVIDGHKRVRALRRLRGDTVTATIWSMSEAEALVLDRSLRQAEAETALEQGWLLSVLHRGLGVDLGSLARRFDRGPSWVSRRLGLVEHLPASVQEHVRQGEIGAHAAMKHLLPMARANAEACVALCTAIAGHRLSTREVGQLYTAWREGSSAMRSRVLAEPLLFLKARREMQAEPAVPTAPAEELLKQIDLLGAMARRTLRLFTATADTISPGQRAEMARAAEQAQADISRLHKRLEQEEEEPIDARAKPTHGDPGATRPSDRDPHDRADPEDLSSGGPEGDRQPIGPATTDPASRASRAVPQADPGAVRLVQGQPGPGP